MPIGKKFGTNEVKQIRSITYFTLVLNQNCPWALDIIAKFFWPTNPTN